ncbi:hypothetical protein VTN77DRAFT_140 [Rasamsonia byssochlamydoides]|uniref:uncharacterized protein n=1 Tax=Rasamsonia byssochlamydoides TaxID=89139 RepID=UPI00374413EB
MSQPPKLKLRSACDACHQAKVRCTGGSSCLHCRNHKQECHYSYAARIGKPKGSRNRKTLARLQCAGLAGREGNKTVNSVAIRQSAGLPAVAVDSSFEWNPSMVAPTWIDNENQSVPIVHPPAYPLLSRQSEDVSYTWLWPPPFPLSPPESVDNCFSNVHINVMSPPPQVQVESQDDISQPPPAPGHIQDIYNTAGNMPWLAADDMVQEANSRCDCLEKQTSKVIRLHKNTATSTFDSGLQCITSTLLACQKTLRCPLCAKDPSLILFIIASIQMAFRQLETLLMGQMELEFSCPADATRLGTYHPLSYEELHNIKQTLLRRALCRAQDTLRDLHSVTSTITSFSKTHSLNDKTASSAIFQYEPSDSRYLQLVVDRLQTGLDLLNGALDGRFGLVCSSI